MKNKKILVVSLVLLIAIGIVAAFLILGTNDKKDLSPKEEQKTEKQILEEKEPPKSSPAENTKELTSKLEEAEVKEVTKDKIVFKEQEKLKKGDIVAVWIYSEPIFLGYFKVEEVDGETVIVGLEEKIAELDLETGDHNIAITTDEGTPIGYVGVTIEEKGELKEEVLPYTKEVTETKTIKFETTTKVNNNLGKGTTKTVQDGVNGEKEITYEVTYDGTTNKEISRKKISEKTTKEAVNKIVEKGGADYNLNTDKTGGSAMGFICLFDEAIDGKSCDISENTAEFSALEISGTYYAICKNNNSACKNLGMTRIKLTEYGYSFTGTINGKKYLFDSRAGSSGGSAPLTKEVCTQYGFVCGTW